ncbi:Cut9-interacting protein scn1 [Malassezia caprae]|uniref:Cut9-interacting protein scn1 n=1 Tax=Malassezia caprae TaxID=1381934 RepID=A0AAF0EC43_9BASI|nr:Cut9-interacting protein scn1 [Malassezia caprae]
MLVDAHCHPTEEVRAGRDEDEWVEAAGEVPLDMLCLMSTDTWDQRLVARAAAAWPHKVVPAFGFHPWCVHTLSLEHPPPPAHEHYEALLGPDAAELVPHLPPPVSLTDALAQLEAYLVAHPHALVGEVGLDRSFRIPMPHTTPRRLSRCQTPLAHQLAVLRAQLALASRYGRSVSMHSVRAAGPTLDMLADMAAHVPGFSAIGVLLHSCTLSVPSLAQVQRAHANVFVSFSTAIQTQHTTELMRASDPMRVLCESDYHAWAELAPRTADAIEAYGAACGAGTEELRARLASNFHRYYHYVETKS